MPLRQRSVLDDVFGRAGAKLPFVPAVHADGPTGLAADLQTQLESCRRLAFALPSADPCGEVPPTLREVHPQAAIVQSPLEDFRAVPPDRASLGDTEAAMLNAPNQREFSDHVAFVLRHPLHPQSLRQMRGRGRLGFVTGALRRADGDATDEQQGNNSASSHGRSIAAGLDKSSVGKGGSSTLTAVRSRTTIGQVRPAASISCLTLCLVASAGCPSEDSEPSQTGGSTSTTITTSTTSTTDIMTTGASTGTTSSTSSTTSGSSGSTGDDTNAGVFDVGMPDLPPIEPPEYGTTPLEQVWYLTRTANDNVLIDFREDPPVVTCGGVTGVSPGIEGTAVFTEPETGDLLFYTDGYNVHNGQTHQIVANGDALSGNDGCTEAALITPYPGQADTFYIFTNGSDNDTLSTISYSVIELMTGPDGTVTTKNQPLMTGNPGEAMDMVPHDNGTDFWVITYDSAAQLHAYRVDSTGVSTNAIVSATGITGDVLRGSINHSEDFDTLLLSAHQGEECGFIATADMDRSSGSITGIDVHVDNCDGIGFQASLSPDATKIYYATGAEGFNGTPWQFDRTTGMATELSPVIGYGGSKLARDGKIYWTGYNLPSLAVVNDPDAAGLDADFQVDGLNLGGCGSGWSVPNQTSAFLDFLMPEG